MLLLQNNAPSGLILRPQGRCFVAQGFRADRAYKIIRQEDHKLETVNGK